MRRVVMVIAVVLWIPLSVMAQTAGSFEELRRLTDVGETVYILDTTGAEAKARIFTVSDTTLTLVVEGMRRELREADVRRIERRRKDSIQNGVLIGAAAGGLLGFLHGKRFDSPSCPSAGSECGQGAGLGLAGGAFWGGVTGWIADVLVRKREVIYARQTPWPASEACTCDTSAIHAVSTRSVRGPRPTRLKPCDSSRLSSKSFHPPSGPIASRTRSS